MGRVSCTHVSFVAGVGKVKQAQVMVHGNGLCNVEYIPDSEGPYEVDVMYAGHHVPNR